ncbi:MAG: acetylglutamate kinase [Deltaproteobacteria bacterium]|nr:acetylglutamate kinase [Deltaproteobacteria bacterium]
MSTKHVLATLSYVKRFAGQTVLIKVGGAALEDVGLVKSICESLTLIRAVGVKVVLVHGGGPAINRELTTHGITWEFIDGQRVTTPEMMDVIEMVLCGHVNKRIVRTLNAQGVPAVGLSGADASTLQCKQQNAKLGQVGQIEKVNTKLIEAVTESSIPVIAPIGVGKNGKAFNINADWAAARLAQGLGIKKMLFLTDQEGILDTTGKVIAELDAGELEQLIESGVVTGGMLAKVRTIVHALRNGVTDVHVLNARLPHGLIEELFTDKGIGTACRLRSLPAKETAHV